jgi:hypothetical protein
MRTAVEIAREHEAMEAYTNLEQQEASGRFYFSGTPLTFGELSRKAPGGRWDRFLLPAMPVNADHKLGRFVPDSDTAVVCVTKLARIATFRALSHHSLHANLPRHQRKTGWERIDGAIRPKTTAAVMDNIRRMREAGLRLPSSVIAVETDAAPFEVFPREQHEYRSTEKVPFEITNITTVNLDLWPDDVEECEPWPEDFDLSMYAPHEPDLDAFLDDLVTQETAAAHIEQIARQHRPATALHLR